MMKWISLRLFLLFAILTGLIYPLFITVIAQLVMPYRANGQLVMNGDQLIGSELIAQKFEKPGYFWPRPSAVDYNPLASGGSNLGPTSAKLRTQVDERRKPYGVSLDLPSELLYASGSGLDPHISLKTALFQADRIAKARGIDRKNIEELIHQQVQGGLLSPHHLNVLMLNIALDDASRR